MSLQSRSCLKEIVSSMATAANVTAAIISKAIEKFSGDKCVAFNLCDECIE